MLHGILMFDGHPSVIMRFLRNIKWIGLYMRYLWYASSLIVRNMSKYSAPTPSVVVLPSSSEWIVMALIEPWTWFEHCGSVFGLCRSKMSFHQALDLIFELDATAVGCTRDILRQSYCLDRCSKIHWAILTFVVIEGEDIITEFCGPSQWKELSKETSSKILSCGDGHWKTFKPIASLIAKGKLK
nr:hypothetical protein [Tanacetum cinerariifolium]